jgi:hypothetical protein
VFPERFYLFGPIDNPTYGCGTPPADPDATTGLYQKYHIMGTLALCSLGLDDFDYHSGSLDAAMDSELRQRMMEFVLPICLNATTFYAEHYAHTGPGGALDMFPSQAEETWQCPAPKNRSNCVTNPSSDIAGLWAITTRLLLPDLATILTAGQQLSLRGLLAHIPPLPVGPRPYKPNPTRKRVYLPAKSVPPTASNSENVELHAIFPFRLTHVGEGETLMNMTVAKTTFENRPFPCHYNGFWCEDGNVAALLGLAEEAGRDVLGAVTPSLSQSSPGWRFPAWHAGGGDTTPSMMPQAILRQTLHSMLLQHSRSGEILLFPAWPAGWDVSFKLHAPKGTVVEARCVNGTISLSVTPASRRADVRVLGCKTGLSSGTSSGTEHSLPHSRQKSDDSSADSNPKKPIRPSDSSLQEPWLLMDLLDVDNTTWGLVVPTASTVQPVAPSAHAPRPPPATYSTGSQVLAVFPTWPAPAAGKTIWFDVYVSNATGWEPFAGSVTAGPIPPPPVEDHTVQLLRYRTQDFVSYSPPQSVLRLTNLKTEEGNTVLKSVARSDRTGLMVMMVDLPGKKVALDGSSIGAGLGGSYGTISSKDGGASWQLLSCSTGCIHKPDKDDLNVLFDTKAQEFVDLQIMWRMNLSMKYCDGNVQGQCQARVSTQAIYLCL